MRNGVAFSSIASMAVAILGLLPMQGLACHLCGSQVSAYYPSALPMITHSANYGGGCSTCCRPTCCQPVASCCETGCSSGGCGVGGCGPQGCDTGYVPATTPVDAIPHTLQDAARSKTGIARPAPRRTSANRRTESRSAVRRLQQTFDVKLPSAPAQVIPQRKPAKAAPPIAVPDVADRAPQKLVLRPMSSLTRIAKPTPPSVHNSEWSPVAEPQIAAKK